jgi:hypothetical protein
VFAQLVSVDAVLDTAKLRIGEQAKVDIYLSYTANKDLKIQWPSIGDTLTEKIEVVSVTPIDTTFPDKSNSSKILQHQQITISVYDSGYYAIPGFKFYVNDDTAHPLYTKPLFLEVHTVPTDTSATKTKDIKPPFEEPFNWEWYIEYAYWGIGLLVVILITILLTIYYAKRQNTIQLEPEKPKVPAHITALAALERIREESVWKEGSIKEYYSQISDAVRLYIEERYNVNALESTTDEIMLAFRTQVVDKDSKDKLQQLLMLSDLVKFAKLFPVETEHAFTIQNAFDFVNGTKREEDVLPENYETAPVQSAYKAPIQDVKPVTPTTPSDTRSNENSLHLPLTAKTAEVITQKREATKGKNIVLIVVCILAFLILVSLTYFLVNKLVGKNTNVDYTVMASTSSSGSAIEQTVQQINQQCPLMLDAETRLDSAILASEKTIRCYSTVINMNEGDVDVELFKEKVRANILSLIRTSPQLKGIREESGTIEYEYRYKTGKQFCIISITPQDYLN